MAETPLPHAAPGAPGEPVATALPSALAELIAGARPLPDAQLSTLTLGTRLSLRLRDEAAIERAGDAFGVALPRKACTFASSETAVAVWLGPDEWFLAADSADPSGVAETIAAAIGDAASSLVDVTERSVTLVLSGAKATQVLNAGCPLDLADAAFPVGSGTRTVLGKSEIVLCRAGPQEFHIDVWRSFAPYVFGLLDEARRDLRA